jgi:hypothetical protein
MAPAGVAPGAQGVRDEMGSRGGVMKGANLVFGGMKTTDD